VLEFIQKYDVLLLDFLNEFGTPMTDPFWLFVTKIYVWIPFFIILFFFALKKFTKKQILVILVIGAIMFGVVLGLTEIVKNIVVRIRPCNNVSLDGLFREVIHPTSFSFYSGHAATSVAIATYFVSLLSRGFKTIYILIIWAFLFMFSRLYLAAHYPSDIIIGAIVGFVIAKLFVYSYKKKTLLKIITKLYSLSARRE